MGSAARKFVEREEFETMKKSMERLSIRVEVLTNDVHQLSNEVGDLSKTLREVVGGLDGLRGDIRELQKGQTAVLSAVLALGRR